MTGQNMAATHLLRFIHNRAVWLATDGIDAGTAQTAVTLDPVLALVRRTGGGLVIETTTVWAGQPQGERLGLSAQGIAHLNSKAVAYAIGLRARFPDVPSVINGMVGPSGDTASGQDISAWHARMAHSAQIAALAQAGAEMVTAKGMTHVAEAIGIAGAASAAGLPCVVSFVIDAEGRLPSGQALDEAIYDVEQLDAAPLWYGVEGADLPADLFHPAQHWTRRIGALRLQGVGLSHLINRLPHLRVIAAPVPALQSALAPRRKAAASRA
ncbi:homocysteine S-methyltransferase family protein [Paragemmobacter aquarius]|nr:homocysteine S-methyltransferase family protein [Gemmobacter aquarius]